MRIFLHVCYDGRESISLKSSMQAVRGCRGMSFEESEGMATEVEFYCIKHL